MPRYEFSEGTSNKFWEVSVQGVEMTVRFGRIGSRGQTNLKTFPSLEEARAAADKLAREKLAKGYRLVEGAAPPSDPDAPDAPDAPVTPPSGAPAAATNPALEDAILANPDDDQAYLVYGDWLQTQGDPRGELIAIQAQMKGQSNPARFLELKKADAALMHAHERRLLGPLADHLHVVKVGWRNGFLRSATVSDNGAGLPGPLQALLDSPASPFLQELTLVSLADRSYQEALEVLCARRPRALRQLALGGERSPLDARIGDLGPVHRAFPGLKRLALGGRGIRFDLPEYPELTRLEVRALDLREGAALHGLGAAAWPRLERLLVWPGHLRIGDLGALQPLLEGRTAPKLTHLDLQRLTPATCDFVLACLARGPLPAQLARLGMNEGVCTEAGARTLLERREAFAKVVLELWVDVSPARLAELTKAFPLARFFGVQRRASDDDEEARDDGIRE